MAKITLSKSTGFTPIPEGTHVFKIISSDYDADYGKLEIGMAISNGQKHIERFHFIKNDGEINEGAQNVFSYFAKTALNDFTLEEIDTDDIVGCYIKATVEHDVQPNKNKPGQTVTFIRLNNFQTADGFDNESPTVETKEQATTEATGGFDLDSILG